MLELNVHCLLFTSKYEKFIAVTFLYDFKRTIAVSAIFEKQD